MRQVLADRCEMLLIVSPQFPPVGFSIRCLVARKSLFVEEFHETRGLTKLLKHGRPCASDIRERRNPAAARFFSDQPPPSWALPSSSFEQTNPLQPVRLDSRYFGHSRQDAWS